MKPSIAITVCLALITPMSAFAQTATVAAEKYSTEETQLGTLLDHPETKAILQKYIPEMLASDQINMARGMTLKALQQYAGDLLTDEKLAQIEADLAKIQPAK